MATGDKTYIADKATLDNVNTKVGAASDTGGSTTAGSVFGKLNKIISDIASFVANWTSTRAGYIDTINTNVASIKTATAASTTASSSGTLSQKLTYIISTLIGATGATGGSATAGTVMAKLNAIITKLAAPVLIKSVQSGKATISGTAYYGATPVSVSINSVTPTKCLVILNGGINISGMYVSVILNSLTATTLKVSTGYGISSAATGHFSWQVIEFY